MIVGIGALLSHGGVGGGVTGGVVELVVVETIEGLTMRLVSMVSWGPMRGGSVGSWPPESQDASTTSTTRGTRRRRVTVS